METFRAAEPNASQTLQNALASFRSGNSYAVANRFEVLLLPPITLGPHYADFRNVSLRCESVSLPGRNLDSLTDTNIYGPTREIVKGVTYAEDVALTFVSSGEFEERVFFEEWQKLAFSEETWNVKYYNDYVGAVDIYVLDRQDKRKFGIKLWEAYPKSITATDLNQNSKDQIIKISVGFTFRYWTSLDANRQPSTGPTAAPGGRMPPAARSGGDNTVDAVSAAHARNYPDNAQGTGRIGWYF